VTGLISITRAVSRRDLRPLLVVAAAAVILATAHSVHCIETGWMMLAPALVLVLPLLSGRFVGEQRLLRWAAARRPVRRRSAPVAHLPRPARRIAVRGTLLAARAAGRAPPRAVLSL
jgi:hypothetical protein